MEMRMSLESLTLSRMLSGVATSCCDDNTVLVRNLLQLAGASYRDPPLCLLRRGLFVALRNARNAVSILEYE